MVSTPLARTHGLVRMSGRDPHEVHRAATPLELLYDLVFVAAFSIAGGQFAHSLEAGHVGPGLLAFTFAMLAMVWAWINYTWFSSAYDTDDWGMRLATLVQMIGVLVFALGIPTMFHSVDGGHFDNRIMVIGYVIMRVSQFALWWRASKSDPARHRTLRRYALCIGAAQVLWVVLAFSSAALHLPLVAVVLAGAALLAFEFWSVYAAERRGEGTPWHPHHIAERYGLLAIISLGEVILGTVTAVEAVVAEQGWSVEAVLIAVAGVSLAFGMWWTYFSQPFGEILERRPHKSFGWGYLHVAIYAVIAAVGAGLHVGAYYVEGVAHIGATGVMLTIAIPLGLFLLLIFGLYHYLLPGRDPFHFLLLGSSLALLVISVLMPGLGTSFGAALVVLMVVPWVTVVGYERVGAGKIEAHLSSS